MITKETINKIVNEYIDHEFEMERNSNVKTETQYNQQYELWLERMEKELNGKVG